MIRKSILMLMVSWWGFFSFYDQVYSMDRKGTLVFGENSTPTTMDPFTGHEISVQHLSDLIFDSLIVLDSAGKYKKALAASYVIEAKGESIQVDLRDNVRWHAKPGKNARMLDAYDVKATIEALIHPKSQFPNKQRFDHFSKVEVLSKSRLKIFFRRIVSDPLRLLLFKVLPKEAFEEVPFLDKHNTLAKYPVGTGPYYFLKKNTSGEVLLEANNQYFGGKPHIKTLIMKPFADSTILNQSLLYGSIDLSTYVNSRDLSEILADKRFDVIGYDDLSYSFLAFNLRKKWLKEKKFRLALMHSINRPEMLKAFFSGKGSPITGPFAPSSWAYNLDVNPVQFDQARARNLLAELGLVDKNGDNRLEEADGKPLSIKFTIPLNGQSQLVKRIVLALTNYFRQIGISVELEFIPWSLWKKRVIENHDFDLTLASWSFDDSSNIYSLFHSSSNKSGGNNFVGFESQSVDELLTEAKLTNDFDKRRLIYHKLHAILAENQAYGFLWNLENHTAFSRRVRGVRVEPFSFFKYITNWKLHE